MIAGVEIGGTKLQIALGDEQGYIFRTVRGKVDLEKGSKGILKWIEDNLNKLIEEQKVSGTQIDAIGIGFGGPLCSESGKLLKSVQVSGWDDFPLKKWAEETFGVHSYVYNDSSAAGWGEYMLGRGQNTTQFFYTNMGSGVGGSLIIDGKLYDGQGFGAAEFGQTRVPDWTDEQIGQDVKLEEICSGWGIEQRLHKKGYVPAESLLIKMCKGDEKLITCEMLGNAVKQGDDFACRELDRIAKTFSVALANVLCLIQPEIIAIGGGVSLIGEPLFERIRKYTKEREFISNKDHYKIVQCALGEAIVLQGAILLAAEDRKKEEK